MMQKLCRVNILLYLCIVEKVTYKYIKYNKYDKSNDPGCRYPYHECNGS